MRKTYFQKFALALAVAMAVPQPLPVQATAEIPTEVNWIWLTDGSELYCKNILLRYSQYFNDTYGLSGSFSDMTYRFSGADGDYIWSSDTDVQDMCNGEGSVEDMLQYFQSKITVIDGTPSPSPTVEPTERPTPEPTVEPTQTPTPSPTTSPPPDSYTVAELEQMYTDLFGSSASQYFITAQATSALVLSTSITLTEEMLSPNYNGGVVDLPRLSYQYYYSVTDSDNYRIAESLYPVLTWTDASKGETATLNICSYDTDEVLWSAKVTNPDLNGARNFTDCSEKLFSSMVGMSTVRRYSGTVQMYDAKLHKTSIVMPGYAYTPNEENYSLSGLDYVSANIKGSAYELQRRRLSLNGTTTSSNIKEYIGVFNNGDLRPALLFGGTKYKDCTFDNNTGVATTLVNSLDVDTLYSFIAMNDACYFYALTQEVVSEPDLNKVTGQTEEWKYDTNVTLAVTGSGPLNFGKWADSYEQIQQVDDKYTFKQTTEVAEDVNVYAESLIYPGVAPHFQAFHLKHGDRVLKINYYIKRPDALDWELLNSVEYDPEEFEYPNMEVAPTITDYTVSGWCIDENCEMSFRDSVTIDPDVNSEYTVYATYRYAGGEYKVRFYNDHTGASEEATYNCNEKPIIPPNPDADAGYAFANWKIVDGEASKDGTIYDPNNFEPKNGNSYLFKTFWDVKGVIMSCLVSQDYTKLPVGTTIDKNRLRLMVVVDNNNTTIQAPVEDFNLDRYVIDKVGVNQFYVTYLPTGATAVCEITGVDNVVTGIEASYNGGPTNVGTELKPEHFKVQAVYTDGSRRDVAGFTISPNIVNVAGQNNITISYTNFNATVAVTGVGTTTPPPTAELESITASYTGDIIYTGTEINPNDFMVNARYGDGTVQKISSNDFMFSPKSFTIPGRQQVTITYGGKSTSVTVAVNQGVGNTPSPSPVPTPTPIPTLQPSTPTPAPVPTPTPTARPSNAPTQAPNTTQRPAQATNRPAANATTRPGGSPAPGASGSPNPNATGAPQSTTRPGSAKPSATEEPDHASEGYLRGSTILSSVMGSISQGGGNSGNRPSGGQTPVSNVDIKGELDKLPADAKTIKITLVNGSETNILTAEILDLMKEKGITANIDIVSPADSSIILGTWVIHGEKLNHQPTDSVNLNITYEVVEKGAETQILITLTQANYPQGIEVKAYPVADAYSAGTLIRLYSCTVTREFSKLQKTFPWEASSNPVQLDPYKYWYYVLSNSLEAYPDGSDLTVMNETEPPTPTDEPPTDVDPGNDPGGDADWSGDESGGDDDWSWDDTTPTEDPTEVTKKGAPIFLFVIIGVVLLILILVIVLLMSSKKGKGQRKAPKQPKAPKQSKAPKQKAPKQPKAPKQKRGPKPKGQAAPQQPAPQQPEEEEYYDD